MQGNMEVTDAYMNSVKLRTIEVTQSKKYHDTNEK